MRDVRHKAELVAMMHELYAEDEADAPVDQSRFPANIVSLMAHPSRGRIILFNEGDLLRGYAVLIPYWSNEFGGTILHVDEMFVVSIARNRGIGRNFFKFLDEARPFDAVALQLEVSPGNTGAQRLYESLGFEHRKNRVLIFRFAEGAQDQSIDGEKLDTDLEQLTKAELVEEIRKLRAGIRRHRDSTGHDLCWHHPELWGLLPEKVQPDLAVPEWPQFLRGCVNYRESLDRQLPAAKRVTDEFKDSTGTRREG